MARLLDLLYLLALRSQNFNYRGYFRVMHDNVEIYFEVNYTSFSDSFDFEQIYVGLLHAPRACIFVKNRETYGKG